MNRFSEDIIKQIILTNSITSSYSTQDIIFEIYVGCLYYNDRYIGTIIDISIHI